MGFFFQSIRDGWQVETPDNWLRLGNVWEFPRPEFTYVVNFYGTVETVIDENGNARKNWANAEEIIAIGYDTPVPGFHKQHGKQPSPLVREGVPGIRPQLL